MKSIAILLISALAISTGGLLAETLRLADSEIYQMKPGTHTFDRIEMGLNSMILLTGTTRLNTKQLATQPGARIEYQKGAQPNDNAKFLELVVLDGSEMRGVFSITGSGADGAAGQHGGNGANGGDEHTKVRTKMVKVLGVKTKVPDGVDHTPPSKGGDGAHGGNAASGEEAMDLDVSMYKLDPSVQCILISNGGNGGDGGNGGNGGNGGRGKRIEHGENGGNGGNGGNAGNGGDAGNIVVRLIYKDGTNEAKIKELQEFLDKNIHAIPGLGGRSGLAGTGGTGGDGGAGGKIGVDDIAIKRGGGKGGASGSNGTKGSPGDNGTTSKELMEGSEFMKLKKKAVDELLK